MATAKDPAGASPPLFTPHSVDSTLDTHTHTHTHHTHAHLACDGDAVGGLDDLLPKSEESARLAAVLQRHLLVDVLQNPQDLGASVIGVAVALDPLDGLTLRGLIVGPVRRGGVWMGRGGEKGGKRWASEEERKAGGT